jgi:hypothetical protein
VYITANYVKENMCDRMFFEKEYVTANFVKEKSVTLSCVKEKYMLASCAKKRICDIKLIEQNDM